MAQTNKLPPKTKGRNYNFFQKITVSGSTFATDTADMIITFPTYGLIFNSEGASSNDVVEYSFDGNNVAGELVAKTGRETLTFLNRNVVGIWFRLKSGSSCVVSVEAWAKE